MDVPGSGSFLRVGEAEALAWLPPLPAGRLPSPPPRALLVDGELDPRETSREIRAEFGEAMPFVVVCSSEQALEWLGLGASGFVPASAGREVALALLEAVASLSESAVGLNPLSGLPGTAAIASRLESDVLHGSATAAYIDITGFKPFNDYYGFSRGDAVLRSLSSILSEHLRGWFLGHIGGDDFLCVGSGDGFRAAVRTAARVFAGRATGFYNAADRARGGIEALDRHGSFRFYPFMELTVSFVTGEGCDSLGRLAAMAGAEKKRARGEEPPATVSGVLRPDGGEPELRDLKVWASAPGRDLFFLKAVIESVGVLGDRSMTGCLAALLREHPDENVRKSAARALGMLSGEEASAAVMEALRDASRHVRTAAASALPLLLGAEAGPRLDAAASDSCTWVRRAALRGLALSAWPGASGTIGRVLASGGAPARTSLDRRMELEAALEGASFLGERSLSPLILPLLDGAHGVPPAPAWRALLTLGEEPALCAVLGSLFSGAEPRFAKGLERFQTEGLPQERLAVLEEALASCLGTASDEDAAHFMAFLGRLPGPSSPALRPALLAMLAGGAGRTEIALQALVKRGIPAEEKEVVRLMEKRLEGPDALGRRGILLLLQWVSAAGSGVTRPFLEKLLRNESREIRTAAARTVVRLAGRS